MAVAVFRGFKSMYLTFLCLFPPLSLVSMNERVWVTEEDELYLIRSTSALLSLIVNQPKLVPLKDRRKVMAKSQDLIAAALNILYTKPDTQPLIDVFRDTQSKLQRIL